MERNISGKLTLLTLTFVSSVLVSSSAAASPSVVVSSSLTTGSSSSSEVSSSLSIDQGTSVLPSVSSVLVLSLVVLPPSLVVSSTSLATRSSSSTAASSSLAIDQSTSVLPSLSSVLVSSTLPGIGATTSLAPTQTASTPVLSGCTSTVFLKGSSGFFSSPNFPNSFPPYSRCTWNITVPSEYIIKISFLHFQLGWQSDGAKLTIYNVTSETGAETLYGWNFPHPVYSVGSSIQAVFQSFTSQFSGFNAFYTAITYESVCPRFVTLNDTSGDITSPYYPRNYPKNEACSWQITARKGKRVILVIEDMDIQPCGMSCDYLEIQNGSFSGDGFPAGRLYGQLRNTVTFYSVHETLKVLFVGRLSGYRGFRATYTQVNYKASTGECSNYTFLNESNRARTYSGITYVCDTILSGWYRFSGGAGSQMAESCVDRGHCGTDSPGWLNGSHPAEVDGAVQRRVCFNHFNNCCHYSTFISVRNCGGFYVYKLDRPSHCHLRYCGNGLSMAPECYKYGLLNDYKRFRTFGASIMLCDNTLSAGWYRFSGEAGNQMAESCVDEYHCGTDVPGWLNGPHPGVAVGRVQRRVCFTYQGICCSDSTYISVRNCGGFYVYKLNPVPLVACSSRYCGDGFVKTTPVTPAETSPRTTEISIKPTARKYPCNVCQFVCFNFFVFCFCLSKVSYEDIQVVEKSVLEICTVIENWREDPASRQPYSE